MELFSIRIQRTFQLVSTNKDDNAARNRQFVCCSGKRTVGSE